MPPPLSPPQARMLAFVTEFVGAHRVAPTLGEACAALGYKSTNAAKELLDRLVAKGYLARVKGRSPRAYSIVEGASPIPSKPVLTNRAVSRHEALARSLAAMSPAAVLGLVARSEELRRKRFAP